MPNRCARYAQAIAFIAAVTFVQCDAGCSAAANDATPLPMEGDPRAVFERLFGDADNPAQRLVELRKLPMM